MALNIKRHEEDRLRPQRREEGMVASSNTYRRCARLIANAVAIDPVTSGQSGRRAFELTLEKIKQHLESLPQQMADSKTEDHNEGTEELDQEDFSENQVLGFMERVATKLATSRGQVIKRADFFREVNNAMVADGGLRSIRFSPKARDGRVGWIRRHMQKFLARYGNVVTVVEGKPLMMKLLPRKR